MEPIYTNDVAMLLRLAKKARFIYIPCSGFGGDCVQIVKKDFIRNLKRHKEQGCTEIAQEYTYYTQGPLKDCLYA